MTSAVYEPEDAPRAPSALSRVVQAMPSARVAPLAILVAAMSCDAGQAARPLPPSAGREPDATDIAAGRALRRLSRREYNNVVHDLLGDTTSPANQFGLEVYVNGFDNGSDALTVQATEVDAFQAAAEQLAATAVQQNLSGLVQGCDPAVDEGACVDVFLGAFAKRAYRRPLTSTEADRLRTVYDAGSAAGGFAGGVELMIEAILQSPAFLYREELGNPDPSLPSNVVKLSPYEVASEISFLVTGSMPDDALLAAVGADALTTADDYVRETKRLLASPGAQPALRAFLHQWMATDQISSLSKDSTAYPSFDAATAASMAGELDRYFDYVLWSGGGSFRELLTSPSSFVDPTLAAIYGVTAPGWGFTRPCPEPVAAGRCGQFAPVTLDPAVRLGVMTRAGFLAVHSDSDSSGPVPRGVFVLNALLCAPPSPPPPNVPPAPPASMAAANHQTTRQRFVAHLSNDACRGCHDVIDGVGFGFEQFDGLGALRTIENGSPVDTSGTLLGTDVDGPFVGVSALAAKLADSEQALGCFEKQIYRYAMGREEDASAAGLLANLGGGASADSRITNFLIALVSDPSFALRTTLAAPSATTSP
jgi:hypothetical protein